MPKFSFDSLTYELNKVKDAQVILASLDKEVLYLVSGYVFSIESIQEFNDNYYDVVRWLAVCLPGFYARHYGELLSYKEIVYNQLKVDELPFPRDGRIVFLRLISALEVLRDDRYVDCTDDPVHDYNDALSDVDSYLKTFASSRTEGSEYCGG